MPNFNSLVMFHTTQTFSILIDFISYHPAGRVETGGSKLCLGSRQATLAWGAVHSSIERSHALSQAWLRAGTQKKGRLRIDRESSKGENQGPDLFVWAVHSSCVRSTLPSPHRLVTYYPSTLAACTSSLASTKEENQRQDVSDPDLHLSGLSVCDYIFRHSLVASLMS